MSFEFPNTGTEKPSIWQRTGLAEPAWRCAVYCCRWAAFLWRRVLFRTTFIAITGSMGKTTTKEYLAAILGAHYRVHATPGTSNMISSLYWTILTARPWHRYVVVEVAVSRPGFMARQTEVLRPDMSVMLGARRAHIAQFKSKDAVVNEKKLLLLGTRRNGRVFMNRDDPRLLPVAKELKCPLTWFGESHQADVIIDQTVSQWPDRMQMQILVNGARHRIYTRQLGTHWSVSVAAAIAVARECGLSVEKCAAVVEELEPVWARMQPIRLPNGTTFIRDDYNGSIDSYRAGLEVLKNARGVRRVAIVGDYASSGQRSVHRSRDVGLMVADAADAAIFLGRSSVRSGRTAIAAGMRESQVFCCEDIEAAMSAAKTLLEPNDLVLIKSQGSQHISRVYLGMLGKVRCHKDRCRITSLCDRCPDLGFNWRPELDGLIAPPDAIY